MDILDAADEAQEIFMRESLSRLSKPLQKVVGIGQCLNCAAEIAGDGRWCDAECRDEHQALLHARSQTA
jgi:hypothetical protein